MEATHPPLWKLLSAAPFVVAVVWLGFVLFSSEVNIWSQWLVNRSVEVFANGTEMIKKDGAQILVNHTTNYPASRIGGEENASLLVDNLESETSTTKISTPPQNMSLGHEPNIHAEANNFTIPDDNATLASVLGSSVSVTANQTQSGFQLRSCAERVGSFASERLASFLQHVWNPVDCAQLTPVRLVLPNAGMGARLNALAPALACLAASHGLPHLIHNNVYINHRVCPSGDLNCYFLPISNCTAHRVQTLHLEDHLRRRNITNCSHVLRRAAGLPKTVSDAWLAKELLQYFMRPNQRLRAFVVSVANQQGLREPYLAIHLRTGQRFTWQSEKKKFNSRAVSDQLRKWVGHARQVGHRSIFFASDLPGMVHTMMQLAEGTGVNITVIPPQLFPTMRSPANQRAEQYLQTYYRTHTTDLDEGLALLGTFLLLSSATETVVTQSSNVAGVIHSLMWCGTKEPNITVAFPKPYGLTPKRRRSLKSGG
eukprot:GGOE01037283.1.p1 GENE.GGOE01037283.1~~GGOE01037283.1.p1  ORF type:complete len:484 (+),score=100.93 GGOE01037283.1:86-1537(+)